VKKKIITIDLDLKGEHCFPEVILVKMLIFYTYMLIIVKIRVFLTHRKILGKQFSIKMPNA